MKLYIDETLKKLRQKNDVTQDTLAEYLGVTYQAVSRWENGLAYPDIELLPDIARFFEVSLEELMGIESNKEKIDNTIMESWKLLSNGKRTDALAKLRELEKEYPNDWRIKRNICDIMVYDREPPFDDVLPELRRYALAAKEEAKNFDTMKSIARTMLLAVPKEEVDEWLPYVINSMWISDHQALYDRYILWKEYEKASEHRSKTLIEYIEFLTHTRNISGNADGNIAPSHLGLQLIETLVGTPRREGEKIENSILLERRIELNTWLAFGYAGSGDTERGIAELAKAVDFCILYCDALKSDYFTSENPLLCPQKNDVENKYRYINWVIYCMTASHGCEWFDPIRDDPRFSEQLHRLREKRTELENYD